MDESDKLLVELDNNFLFSRTTELEDEIGGGGVMVILVSLIFECELVIFLLLLLVPSGETSLLFIGKYRNIIPTNYWLILKSKTYYKLKIQL